MTPAYATLKMETAVPHTPAMAAMLLERMTRDEGYEYESAMTIHDIS